MDGGEKKDLVRTVIMAAFFLVIAFVLLNYVIGNAMDPLPPRR